MTSLWFVRKYKEGDQCGILDLMKLTGIERAGEQWVWEYKNNPFGHLIAVAEHDGQIVGHMALIPTYMKIGNKVTMGSQAVDLVVHPKFRRQGMFLAIGKFLTKEAGKEGIELTYGFPNERAHSGHLKYGWFDVCKVPVLVKPINLNSTVHFLDKYRTVRFLYRYKIPRNVMKTILQIILTGISFFSRLFNRIEENDALENVEISTIQSFDNRIDDFWKEVSNNFIIAVERDKKYLNWRYFEKPNVRYTVLLAEKRKKILGFIVLLSKNEKNLRLGYIVDILALLDKKNIIQSLISRAIGHFKEEGVDLIVCWMLKKKSAHVYYRVLRYNGFMHLFGRSRPLIARVNSSQSSKTFLCDSSKWYITMGDSDSI
jgi:GNAT superfamily N-acetyltransferase